MKPPIASASPALEQRWDRLGVGVRCAYDTREPALLLRYLQAGRSLSRQQPQREAHIQGRMLELLLRTAGDGSLPWAWRIACLEQTPWPLARLASLWRRGMLSETQSPDRLDERVRQISMCLDLAAKDTP